MSYLEFYVGRLMIRSEGLSLKSQRPVLVVDDSADVRELFVLLAELNDFALITASNGEEALVKLATLESDPAIVFVDLNMPVMNGREFVRLVQARGLAHSSRIVIFSAAVRETIGKLDESLSWLAKPFNVTDVMRVIRLAHSH